MKASEIMDQEKSWVVVKRKVKKDIFVAIDSEDTGCSTGHCGAGVVGCQSNAFVGLFASAPLLKLKNAPITVSVGDRLLLSLPRRSVFQLAFLGYGLPLIVLIVGLWLGQMLQGDWGALLLGLTGLLLTWLVIGKLGLVVEPSILEVQSVAV